MTRPQQIAPIPSRLLFALGAVLALALGAPAPANAQGLVQGVQQGAREGNKAAGPVGGVLGVAGRNVAVAWNQIQFFRDANTIKAKTNLTEEQLKAMPEYTSDGGVWHTK